MAGASVSLGERTNNRVTLPGPSAHGSPTLLVQLEFISRHALLHG